MLNVADATLASVQAILTRIHTLIVEAASDLNSDSQLSSIQSEINTLLLEVNKIAGAAKYNGLTLFNGSLDGTAGLNASPSVVQITPALNPDGSVPTSQVYAQVVPMTANPGPLLYNPSYTQTGEVPGIVQIQITGYSSNPVDPVTGTPLGQPGVYVRVTEYSQDPNFGGTNGATEQIYTQALPTDTGPDFGSGFPIYLPSAGGTTDVIRVDFANLSQQDVGAAMAYETYNGTNTSGTPTGQSMQVNSTGVEGGVVTLNLPGVSTNSLNISGISVERPQVVDAYNNPIGEDGTNNITTMDAETRVQNAIDTISQVRAQVGAQTVSLQEDASNAGVQVVNQTAAVSAIRDTDVAQATTAFVRDQVLAQIDVSVMSQMQVNALLVSQVLMRGTDVQSAPGHAGGRGAAG